MNVEKSLAQKDSSPAPSITVDPDSVGSARSAGNQFGLILAAAGLLTSLTSSFLDGLDWWLPPSSDPSSLLSKHEHVALIAQYGGIALALVGALIWMMSGTSVVRAARRARESAERDQVTDPVRLAGIARGLERHAERSAYLRSLIETGTLDERWLSENALCFGPEFLATRGAVPETMVGILDSMTDGTPTRSRYFAHAHEVFNRLPAGDERRATHLDRFDLDEARLRIGDKLDILWSGPLDSRGATLRIVTDQHNATLPLDEVLSIGIACGALTIDGAKVTGLELAPDEVRSLVPMLERAGTYIAGRTAREHARARDVARAGARRTSGTSLVIAALVGGVIGAAAADDD